MPTSGKNWIIGVLVAVVVILVVVITVVSSSHHDSDRTVRAEVQPNVDDANPENAADAKEDTLKVWVPAGFVGNEYWVYLNGHIVSSPAQRKAVGITWRTPWGRATNGSYLLSNSSLVAKAGDTLIVKDGEFTDSLDS